MRSTAPRIVRGLLVLLLLGGVAQQMLHERVIHIPIYELAFIWGVGPTVDEPGVNLIRSFAYSGPLEDLRLKRP